MVVRASGNLSVLVCVEHGCKVREDGQSFHTTGNPEGFVHDHTLASVPASCEWLLATNDNESIIMMTARG